MTTPAASSARQDVGRSIRELITKYQQATNVPGVCVAVCYSNSSGNGTLVIPFGTADLNSKYPVEANTVFELGSVTKVFTSLLTAYAIVNPPSGRSPSLTDPVLDYLSPYGVKGSSVLAEVTLGELATHTSGMPDEGPASASRELFADEAPSNALISYWNSYEGPAPPHCWVYSNIGFVTLGFAVSQLFAASGDPVANTYNQLLSRLVTVPLGMPCTSASPLHSGCSSVAKGYLTADNHPAPGQAFDLKSTGEDMLTFLRANLKMIAVSLPLATSIALTQTVQETSPVCGSSKDMTMGLGWQMPTVDNQQMFYKNGATSLGGFTCAVEFVPEANFGVAVLTNQDGNKSAGANPSTLAAAIRNLLNPSLSDVAFPFETAETGG